MSRPLFKPASGKPASAPRATPKPKTATVVMARVVEPEDPVESTVPEDFESTVPEDVEFTVPEDVEFTVPEDVEDPVGSSVSVTASGYPDEKYLRLYTDHIRIQEENVRLHRKMIRLEENLKQWQMKKATKKAKLEGEELTNAIVDIILKSNLNIESLPDDVERELYCFIINQISAASGSVSCLRKLFFCA